MKNKISDRSREFSQEALQRIEEIQSKYKSCPVYEKLTKEELECIKDSGKEIHSNHKCKDEHCI